MDKERITFLIKASATGIIDHVEETLYEYKAEIESMLKSGVELTLSENKWNVQQALLETVKEIADINEMLEEYEDN